MDQGISTYYGVTHHSTKPLSQTTEQTAEKLVPKIFNAQLYRCDLQCDFSWQFERSYAE